jgi:hypothetical protein
MTGAPHNIKHHRLPRETTRRINVTDPDSRNQDDPGLAAGPAQFVQGESRAVLQSSTSEVLTTALRDGDDPLVMIVLRLLYTAAVMVVVIWLLRNGNPLAGLLLVPAAAVWLRREAESGRLAARVRRAFRH